MEIVPEMYALAVGAGLLAGVINTLAGSGSLVTLYALVAMGLPATVANGTNRIGVLIQSGVALATMRAHGVKRPTGLLWMVTATTAGAVVGAWGATQTDPDVLEWVIIGVMWATLLAVFFRRSDWSRKKSEDDSGRPSVTKIAVLVLVGAWGGFLQAGVGILLLVALVLVAGKNVIEATTIKLVVVLVYTVVTIPIFLMEEQIHLELGLVMGLGQAVGGWLGGRFAATSPRAPIWIRRLLVVVIVVAALELMGAFAVIGGLL